MFVKQRGEPLELYRIEALQRRLAPQHRMKEKVSLDFKRTRTGVRGEKEVDYPLSFLNEQDYLILQHLRLPDQNGSFQIDNLILSEKYILILEVKNWYGTVIYGDNGQVIRVGDHGIEEGFSNPIPQAKLQQHRLQKWLHSHGFPNIPIDFFVVISFPSTIIKSASVDIPIPDRVIHNSQLFFEIKKVDETYQQPIIKMPQLLELAQQLKKAHIPPDENILGKYGIRKGELIRGVFCPNCAALPMIRKMEQWYCRACQHKCKYAHFSALNDYKRLVSNAINNREARDFLRVGSPDIIKRLLQMGDYVSRGNTSNRVYELRIRQ